MESVTLLRAELMHGATTIVGHTTVLTPSRVFVRTDEMLDLGTSVDVALSFRGALDQLRFRGTVTEHRHPAGPGELGGLWFSLEAHSADDLLGLRAVLEMPATTRQIRMLMVDDSSLTRDVFTYAVSHTQASTRVRVDSVADAEEAWTQLQTGAYHLLLVDHFLPASTGADLITRVRSDPKLRTLPIVGISIGGKVARDAMVDAGVDVFLEKPVQVRDLMSTLDRLAGLGDEASA